MPYSGRYLPSHPKKYVGDSKNMGHRSLWGEKSLRTTVILNESIQQWQSEEFWIPYISPIDNRMHRYFPDFFIKYNDKTGKLRTMVVEIKPKKAGSETKYKSQASNKSMGKFCEDLDGQSSKMESSKRVLCRP